MTRIDLESVRGGQQAGAPGGFPEELVGKCQILYGTPARKWTAMDTAAAIVHGCEMPREPVPTPSRAQIRRARRQMIQNG